MRHSEKHAEVIMSFLDYSYTLNQYHARKQRSLMTKELRQQIMVRDNYTYQICGKHMSDEVGLQIDHIIPVSEGGKTVPSNLQVLCSKCNGKNQIDEQNFGGNTVVSFFT